MIFSLVYLLGTLLPSLYVNTVSASSEYIVPPATDLAPSSYQKWAHKHWVWNHNGNNYQQSAYDLVDGYLSRDIPVGNVNIDSMWATQFNNFEINKDRFPDFATMVQDMHAKGVKVTVWATSMVNVENPDYEFCLEKGYLVRNGQGIVRPVEWWHGSGAFLDYSNPEALSWWHSKMDNVLDMEIDGFKVDGTDPYILEYILFTGDALGYNNVSLSYRDYANYYYRDFFYYTREKRGDVGLIMSRPIDCQLDSVSSLCTPFSPYDVMLSGWVGDDDATYNGLRGVLSKFIYSAWDNYTNFGSDIGGYRGEETTDKNLFIRWAQLGAFVPLMENGGGGEHRPWMIDDETVEIYRNFVNYHYQLIPYFMKIGLESLESNGQIGSIRPVAVRPDVYPARNVQPSTFSYRLGEDILVHPIAAESFTGEDGVTGNDVRMVFPVEDATWLNYFAPWNSKDSIKISASGAEGENVKHRFVTLDSYPVYVRRGALISLQKSASDESVIFTWFSPLDGEAKSTAVREVPSEGPGLVGKLSLFDGVISGSISAHQGGAGWTVYGVKSVSEVSFQSIDPSSCSYEFNKKHSSLSAFCTDVSIGATISARVAI